MDFHLTKEQLLVRKMYREFAENEVKPLAAEIDEELDRYRSQRLPAIILIPGVSGTRKSVSPWRPSRRWLSWA